MHLKHILKFLNVQMSAKNRIFRMEYPILTVNEFEVTLKLAVVAV